MTRRQLPFAVAYARHSVIKKAGLAKSPLRRSAKRRAMVKADGPSPKQETVEAAAATETVRTSLPTEKPTTAAALAEVAQEHALEALRVLAEAMTTAASETVRVSAANSMLDRGYGKPAPGGKALGEAHDGPIELRWVDPDFP